MVANNRSSSHQPQGATTATGISSSNRYSLSSAMRIGRGSPIRCNVKSIASGSYVTAKRGSLPQQPEPQSPPKMKSRSLMSSTMLTSTADQQEVVTPTSSSGSNNSQRVVINTSTASYHSSLALTTVRSSGGADEETFTAGSTATGDSFVPHLDDDVDDPCWRDTASPAEGQRQQLDTSFEDPYLKSRDQLLARKRNELSRPGGLEDFGDASLKQQPSSNSSPPQASKSLGCFEFPLDAAEEDNVADVEATSRTNTSSLESREQQATSSSPMETLRHMVKISPLFGSSNSSSNNSRTSKQSSKRGGSGSGGLSGFLFPRQLSIPRKLRFALEPDDDASMRSSMSSSDHADGGAQRRHAAAEQVAYYTTLLQQPHVGNRRRAQLLLQLGAAQQDAARHQEAIETYSTAAGLFRQAQLPVALARALDRTAVACTAVRQWDRALDCLQQALNLQLEHLDKWHVDTVDTLNHMGNVYMHAGRMTAARKCYWEVFWVRKAIFGAQHPAVAVAAHELANALYRSGYLEDADNFYQISWSVYENMGMSSDRHAGVARLLRNMRRLERVERMRSSTSSQLIIPEEDLHHYPPAAQVANSVH